MSMFNISSDAYLRYTGIAVCMPLTLASADVRPYELVADPPFDGYHYMLQLVNGANSLVPPPFFSVPGVDVWWFPEENIVAR